ncbi:MAG: hypothetical protein Q9218_007710, partial [Villophora microphyllina]
VNGRVILNAGLQKSLKYTLTTPKQVRIPVATTGKISTWMVKFDKEAKDDEGKKLVKVLEENKGN